MSEFILYKKALEEYQQIMAQREKPVIDSCPHDNIIEEKGIGVCIDCGEEIQNKTTNDKEWRYYGSGDNKHYSDPTRVQQRKSEDKNIFKDVDGLGFSDNIVAKANRIYAQVTQEQIFRANSRKAIVFACIFHACKISGNSQSYEKLLKVFRLNKKIGLKGLKYVSFYAPKDSKIRTTYITPINLIGEIMDQFTASKEQTKEVIDLYEKIKNKSSKLNRSRPLSVASGIVYYWITQKNKSITLKEFAKKVSLSELTINKIKKEIEEIFIKFPDITT